MSDFQTLAAPEARRRFNELHTLYRGVMLNVAAGVLKDLHLAEDAVQEAFIRIFRNLHKIGDTDCPPTRAFVVTIVRNVSLNMLAKLGRQVPTERMDPDLVLDDSLEDIYFRQMDYEQVLSIIYTLPPIYEEALSMYYVQQLDTNEIAEILSLKVETVKKRIQRGKRIVLDGLTKQEWDKGTI